MPSDKEISGCYIFKVAYPHYVIECKMNIAITQRNFILSKTFRLNWLVTIRLNCKNTKWSIFCKCVSALKSHPSLGKIQVWFRKYKIPEMYNLEYSKLQGLCNLFVNTRKSFESRYVTRGLDNRWISTPFKHGIYRHIQDCLILFCLNMLHVNHRLPLC